MPEECFPFTNREGSLVAVGCLLCESPGPRDAHGGLAISKVSRCWKELITLCQDLDQARRLNHQATGSIFNCEGVRNSIEVIRLVATHLMRRTWYIIGVSE